MRRSRPGLVCLWSILALLGACDPAPATQTMVTVDAESGIRAATASVHVEVTGTAMGAPVSVRDFSSLGWPALLALVPQDNDASRTYEVKAEARDRDGGIVAFARVRSGYVAEETKWLEIVFRDTCDSTAPCGPSDVSAASLPPWAGLPTAMDAGVDNVSVDTGTDLGVPDVIADTGVDVFDAGPPCTTEASGFEGGSGDAVSPFLICSGEQLMQMAAGPSLSYRLTRSFEWSADLTFPTIDSFSGHLDGQGFTVHGLRTGGAGMFKLVEAPGIIEDLVLRDSIVTCNRSETYCGTLAGLSRGLISRVHVVNGTLLAGAPTTGGVAGRINGPTDNISFHGEISSQLDGSTIGGVVGQLLSGPEENAQNLAFRGQMRVDHASVRAAGISWLLDGFLIVASVEGELTSTRDGEMAGVVGNVMNPTSRLAGAVMRARLTSTGSLSGIYDSASPDAELQFVFCNPEGMSMFSRSGQDAFTIETESAMFTQAYLASPWESSAGMTPVSASDYSRAAFFTDQGWNSALWDFRSTGPHLSFVDDLPIP